MKDKISETFLREFCERNGLSHRIAQSLEPKRVKASDRQLVVDFIDVLLKEVKDECRTTDGGTLLDEDFKLIFYNVDETAVSTFPQTYKVWCEKGQKTLTVRELTNKYDSNSLIICGSAAGVLLTPFVIFRGSELKKEWTHWSGAKYAVCYYFNIDI